MFEELTLEQLINKAEELKAGLLYHEECHRLDIPTPETCEQNLKNANMIAHMELEIDWRLALAEEDEGPGIHAN